MLELSEADVMKRFEPTGNAVQHGLGYGRLSGLTLLATREANFYFREGTLQVMHITDWSLENGGGPISGRILLSELGEPAANRQSRAGRGHRLYVYPQLGIAFSSTLEHIDFVDVFRSTDLATYDATLGQDEPAFFR